MKIEQTLKGQWMEVRDRLVAKQLALSSVATLSLRIPDPASIWVGRVSDPEPRRIARGDAASMDRDVEIHAAIYAAREDVGAIAIGGGAFGRLLADVGGTMPGVFDEQVRHLGRMSPAISGVRELGRALRAGGNTLLVGKEPVCLGMTASRLVLNAELFEKCAKAFVLAAATGEPVAPLPWLVRRIANGRLMKDERKAGQRIRQGMLPEESRGY
ncbi:hypothetical protein SB778_30835 [Paraburkholderia sp. SIMBA_050]